MYTVKIESLVWGEDHKYQFGTKEDAMQFVINLYLKVDEDGVATHITPKGNCAVCVVTIIPTSELKE